MANQDQANLMVHHVRFYNCQPQTINCICHDSTSHRVAVSRADGSVEIFTSKDNWVQELVFPGNCINSVEAVAWAGGRLFTAGLAGNITELDLATQSVMRTVSSNAGPVWCLTTNASEDQLAAGTEDGCVVLFDVSEELQYLRGFGKQEGRIVSVAWYENEGESVIVTGGINNIRQWSVKSGQPLSRMSLGRKFQKDTIVWCVAVAKDFTIISGDSRGVVTFWNGKESTQLKTFHCHKADVLDLCLSKDEQKVYSCGVDAALFQFSLYLADPNSERKRWVQQLLHNRHTHDIRALAYKDGCLASGGVDAVLKVAGLKAPRIGVWEVDPFPLSGLVNVSTVKNLVQLQYATYIEVWRLGDADIPTGFPSNGTGVVKGILPLTKKPLRLLQLKAQSDRHILCSAVSSEPILAYSDTEKVRLYQMELNNEDSSTPEVSLTKLPCRLLPPARLMTFTLGGQVLVIVSTSGQIHMVSVNSSRKVEYSVKAASASPIHRLCGSPTGSYFATATTNHDVHIYSATTGQHVCSCPVQQYQISALAFSPHSPTLVIAYSNHTIYEFDIEKVEYTEWSRGNSKLLSRSMKSMSNIRNITFSPNNVDQIIYHTDCVLCVLDKSKAKGIEEVKPKKDQKRSNLRKCFKYKFLLSAQFLSNGMLVVVEYTSHTLEENLPPSLKQKKFGVS